MACLILKCIEEWNNWEKTQFCQLKKFGSFCEKIAVLNICFAGNVIRDFLFRIVHIFCDSPRVFDLMTVKKLHFQIQIENKKFY